MKQIAIIAPTASGKTELSINIAKQTNSIILSLDSLAIYKEINIASAKPTIKERGDIIHFGIDEILPSDSFDVMKYIDIYKQAKEYALHNKKNLIIVGGTSFYLKSMIEGISYIEAMNQNTKNKITNKLDNYSLQTIYDELYALDKDYMKGIKTTDKYRIEKALSVYMQTNTIPSIYFKDNPAKAIITNIKLFEIVWDKETLRNRIAQRTKNMIKDGLINEVIYLEKKYSRKHNCMASIGIKECLDYLDGKISFKELEQLISIATSQLAKRQRTFNKGQFKDVTQMPLAQIQDEILRYFIPHHI
jgi:tRNA dimethylallyltransferase